MKNVTNIKDAIQDQMDLLVKDYGTIDDPYSGTLFSSLEEGPGGRTAQEAAFYDQFSQDFYGQMASIYGDVYTM